MAKPRPKAANAPDNSLYRRRLGYRQNRRELAFDVAEGLFSATNIDAGTVYLLCWLGGTGFDDVGSVLDLGCGYGPIGIGLASFSDDR
jgi:16S rRNA G1207 methylase RsmC